MEMRECFQGQILLQTLIHQKQEGKKKPFGFNALPLNVSIQDCRQEQTQIQIPLLLRNLTQSLYIFYVNYYNHNKCYNASSWRANRDISRQMPFKQICITFAYSNKYFPQGISQGFLTLQENVHYLQGIQQFTLFNSITG